MKNIAVLMGDGVAGEILNSAIEVLNKVSQVYNLKFEYNYQPIGGRAYDETGFPLPEKTIEACLKSDAVLLGAVGDWKYDNLKPELRPEKALLGIRKKLNLFANLRPVKVFDELLYASPLKPEIAKETDVMIVRELTGDVYFGEPKGIAKKRALDGREIKVGFNNMIYDEDEIRRIAHVAFQSAQKRKKRVCCVDKANVLDVHFKEIYDLIGSIQPEKYHPEGDSYNHTMIALDNCAKITKDEFISSLKEMTLLEIKELVDAMQEEFGVDINSVAVAAPQQGAQQEEGPSKLTVVLTNAGAAKINVIKIIRDVTGLGLKDAKDLADNGGNIKENVSNDEANEIKAKLEEAGATVELV